MPIIQTVASNQASGKVAAASLRTRAERLANVQQQPGHARTAMANDWLLHESRRPEFSPPNAVSADDLQKLRDLGWSDSDMLDAVSHGARNRAVDVIFNTFKVENDFQEA